MWGRLRVAGKMMLGAPIGYAANAATGHFGNLIVGHSLIVESAPGCQFCDLFGGLAAGAIGETLDAGRQIVGFAPLADSQTFLPDALPNLPIIQTLVVRLLPRCSSFG